MWQLKGQIVAVCLVTGDKAIVTVMRSRHVIWESETWSLRADPLYLSAMIDWPKKFRWSNAASNRHPSVWSLWSAADTRDVTRPVFWFTTDGLKKRKKSVSLEIFQRLPIVLGWNYSEFRKLVTWVVFYSLADVDWSKGLSIVLVVSGHPLENIMVPHLILYPMHVGWFTCVQGGKVTLIARVIEWIALTTASCGWVKIEELRTWQPCSLVGLNKTPSQWPLGNVKTDEHKSETRAVSRSSRSNVDLSFLWMKYHTSELLL